MTDPWGLGICTDCWRAFSPWRGPACRRCGLPIPSERALDSARVLCAYCLREEFDFDLARSYGLYTGILRAAILHLKFKRRERLGERLGGLLVSVWELSEELRTIECPLVVPVPLHPARLRERGFNQAALLAQGLVGRLRNKGGRREVQIGARCLARIRHTAPQTGLSISARRENVRGVFAVTSEGQVRGRAVLLVDDVMTTGATLSAGAAALKRAGAARVVGIVLARATPEFPDAVGRKLTVTVDEVGHESA